LVDPTTTTRAQRAAALERWADDVDADDLVEAKTASLRTIAELVEQRDDVDTALLDAIRDARNADRSWSEIGAMLGVSKQAAQRKYAAKISAQPPAEVDGSGAHFAQPNSPTDRSGTGELCGLQV
jgi:hypothetical protein